MEEAQPCTYTLSAPEPLLRGVGAEWAGWELSRALAAALARRAERLPLPRKKRREGRNILERWFLAAANHNPPPEGAEATEWAVHRDLGVAGYRQAQRELVEQGLAPGPVEAQKVAAALLALAEKAMAHPFPTPSEVSVTVGPDGVGADWDGRRFHFRARGGAALQARAAEVLGGEAGGAGALLRAALRYAAVLPNAQHWGLPLGHARELYRAGFRYEGFASPFNSRMVLLGEPDTHFCSLFGDTDAPFGSLGSFFGTPLAALGGKWAINPPYLEALLERVAAKAAFEAEAAAAAGTPLQLHFLLPAWDDAAGVRALVDSPHALGTVRLLPGAHCLETPEGRVQVATFGTLYVVWAAGPPLSAAERRRALGLARAAKAPCPDEAAGPDTAAGPGGAPPHPGPPAAGGGDGGRLCRNLTSFPVEVVGRLRALEGAYRARRAAPPGERDEEARIAATLRYYQYLVREAFRAQDSWIGGAGPAGARGLLVYHAMGTGKTLLAVAVAAALWGTRPPLVVVAKALQRNFSATVAQYVALLRPDLEGAPLAAAQAAAAARFRMVSLDANNMATLVARATDGAEGDGALDGRLLIVDEAHNFFRAVINSADEKTNARRLYEMVMGARNLRLLFLTGTPASKDPFELVPCFNMLAGFDLLPPQYEVFQRLYVDRAEGSVRNRGKLANRLVGLVTHASHARQAGAADPSAPAGGQGGFPTELPLVVERLEMGAGQYRQYLLAREKEEAEGRSGDRAPPGGAGVRNSPPLALPSSEAGGGSTYYVRSRMLGNFAPPPPQVAGRSAGEATEPEDLPDAAFHPGASPKAARLLENLALSRGPALVYSQFVHGGGLGMLARYLRLAGYAPYVPEAAGGADQPAACAAAARSLVREWGYAPPWAAAIGAAAPPQGRPSRWVDPEAPIHGVKYCLRGCDGPGAAGVRLDGVMNLHRGQRKLFVSELLGLTHFLPRADAPAEVVYAGAARGDHLWFLADLFPGATFHLYDPNPFHPRLGRAPERFRVHSALFTDALAESWRGRCDLFISDIRSVSPGMSGGTAEFEERVAADMAAQERWARLIAPRRGCLLKFRPPYLDPSGGAPDAPFSTLRGRVMWQAWPPKTSTEGRLLVEAADAAPGAPSVAFDARRYQDACFHHNVVARPWGAYCWKRGQGGAGFAAATAELRRRVPGYDGCFDCALEARAWADYLALPGVPPPARGPAPPPEPSAAQVGALMGRLTRELHKGLTPLRPAPPPFHGAFAGCPARRIRRAVAAWEEARARMGAAGQTPTGARRAEGGARAEGPLAPSGLHGERALGADEEPPSGRSDEEPGPGEEPPSGGSGEELSPEELSSEEEEDGPPGGPTDGPPEPPAPPAPSGPPLGEAPSLPGPPRYAIISGEVPAETRARIQAAFNSPANRLGGVIRVLLVSKTGAEGLDLKGVRQVHILEPYWDKAREAQVRARGVRLGSHDHLPIEEREVQPFLYLAVPDREMWEAMQPKPREQGAPPAQRVRLLEERTIDEEFHARGEKRYRLNQAFRDLLREVSIECALTGADDCRLCVPTGARLYHEDPLKDLQLPDPCFPLAETEVQARELEFEGGRYFYREGADLAGGPEFFEYDPAMDAHVPVDPASGLYLSLLDLVGGGGRFPEKPAAAIPE